MSDSKKDEMEEENNNKVGGNDDEIQEEDVAPRGVEDDEGLGDWEFPANYNSLKGGKDLTQKSVWQCVKRPWKPGEYQLTPSQLKKKQQRIQKQAAAGLGTINPEDAPEMEEDDEPGEGGEEDDKFHYYWRLATPKTYLSAGAAGMHWRAIKWKDGQKPDGQDMQTNSIKVAWLNEGRWRAFCGDIHISYQSIALHTIEDGRVVAAKKSDNNPDKLNHNLQSVLQEQNLNCLGPTEKRKALIYLINTTWAEDANLQKAAQRLMTETELIQEGIQDLGQIDQTIPVDFVLPNLNSNHNVPIVPAHPELPFRFEDGTFAYTKGSGIDAPTWESGDNGPVDRLYVKLRRKHVKLLEVSGGTFKATVGDTFILKTTLDQLAGMPQDEKHPIEAERKDVDPTAQTLNSENGSQGWTSDPRVQMGEQEIEEQEKAREEKLKSKGVWKDYGRGPSDERTRGQRYESHEEAVIWARNANGFAFQFAHRKMERKAWNKCRMEAIGTLDEDRGWTRYIDPAIDLYIVPSSDDPSLVRSMHISIVRAMYYLDIPGDRLKIDDEIKTRGYVAPQKSLARLKTALNAKPDCATKEIHLILRSGIATKEFVKLASSPFGHFETWITRLNWTSYTNSRQNREIPHLTDRIEPINRAQIEEGIRILKVKGAKAKSPKRDPVTDAKTKKEVVATTTAKTQSGKKGNPQGLLETKQERKSEASQNKIDDKNSKPQDGIEEEKEQPKADFTALRTKVSSTKIRQARGTRAGVLGQAAVMGGSATLVAQAFGWPDAKKKTNATSATTTDPIWPRTSHMPAEWLHRCAYSWGGLKNDPISSQSPKNLIFGTGECNSVMTRFEKAWQALVCREGDRYRPPGVDEDDRNEADTGSGILYANINRKIYSENFGYEEFPGNGIDPIEFVRNQPATSQEQIDKLPHWLCYALNYELKQKNAVAPLGNRTCFETTFFPWQRGFFTKFEQTLDEAVLELAYETWEADNPPSEPVKDTMLTLSGQAAVVERKPGGKVQKPAGKNRRPDQSCDDSADEELRDKGQGKKVLKTEAVTKHDGEHGGMITEQDQSFSMMSLLSSNQIHERTPPVMIPDNELFSSTIFRKVTSDAEPDEEASVENAAIPEETVEAEESDNVVVADAAAPTTAGPTWQMSTVWEEVHAPGPTSIDGLLLSNAKIVVRSSDPANSIEATEITTDGSGINVSIDNADRMTAGLSENDEEFDIEASGLQTTNGLAVGEASLLDHLESLPEPLFDYLETKNTKTSHAPPEMRVENPFFAERTLSTQKATIQQHQEPAAFLQQQNFTETQPIPNMFVVQADFLLFGKHKVQLYSLQSASQMGGQYLRITLPKELSLGAFMPSLAGSDLDAIAMRDTIVTYRSRGRRAGLMLATTITLSGVLQPVNSLLRDVFGQTTPRIDVTTLLSSSRSPTEALMHVPKPLGFTLRGELPEVNIPNLFGVLTVTHIGVDVMGSRLDSAGGYDLGYGFFGRGHIREATPVEWRIDKFGEQWSISIYTESTAWKNIPGIDGVDLTDVFLEAAWTGAKLSTTRLDLLATFSIKEQATLMLQGKFAKDDFEVAGYLTDCSLTTLKKLYSQTFKTDIDVTTNHDIVLNDLVLIVSKSTGISLYGRVSVDGHEAAEAGIHIGGGSIDFEGAITGEFSVGSVKIDDPALAVSIYTSKSSTGSGFEVQFSGQVTVNDEHHFDVLVYLNKRGDQKMEYTLYGSYDGEFYLHDLMDSLKDSDLLGDVGMQKLAICASNIDNPGAMIKIKPPGYDIGRGLTVYAEILLPTINGILNITKGIPFLVAASYRPAKELGDGSKFQLSIRVPQDTAFKIEGFSVENLSLAVEVVSNIPSVKISGDLSFPVEDNKHLTLGLGLSAGVYEATGHAKLNTPWVNPFDLSTAVTIHDLKLGLGISYAGVPSSVTLGGAVLFGDVKGSVLIHTGVDPSKQLLHVKIVNLNVAEMLRTIGKLIDVDLTIPGGNNAFFIRNFDLYLSTGMELFGMEYPRGIKVEVDMMLFGKHATLDAQITKGHVKLKGSIERFKIGDAVVAAASGNDKDPYVDIELSQEVQKLKVDGKIAFLNDNWVMLLVEIDTTKGVFSLHFELVVGDALKILVIAKLQDGLPEAEQNRVEEIEPDKSSDGSLMHSKTQSLYKQISTNVVSEHTSSLPGGQLEGKTFNIYVKVDNDIISYLVKLANDNLGGERDPSEQGRLQTSLNTAKAALDAAHAKYDAAKDESDAAIKKATKSLDERWLELWDCIRNEQTLKKMGIAELDRRERDTVMKAKQDERDLAVSEEVEAAAADHAARMAHVAVEEWQTRVYALTTADMALQVAIEAQEAAEAELAATQVSFVRHAQQEPIGGTSNPEFEAWVWMGRDIDARVNATESNAKRAVDDVKLAKSVFHNMNIGSVDEANAKLADLLSTMKQADAAAKARRAAVAVNFAAGIANAEERRANLQKRRAAFIAHKDAKIYGLREKEAAFQRDRTEKLDAIRAKNDVSKTEIGETFEKCLETHRAADVKLRAYNHLKESFSTAGEGIRTALRFAGNVMGKAASSILSIQSFVLDGTFNGKSSKVSATVNCKVAGYAYPFTIEIDLGDIVSFFKEMWNEIKRVVSSVANALIEWARKGIEAIKKFCREAADGIKTAVNATADVFMKGLADHQNELAGFFDDFDEKVLRGFKDATEKVLKEIGQSIDRAGKELTHSIIEIGSRLDKIGRDLSGPLGPLGPLGDMAQRPIDRYVPGLLGSIGIGTMEPIDDREQQLQRLIERLENERIQTEERERAHNSGVTEEDVQKGEKEVAQMKEEVHKGEMQLTKLYSSGQIGEDDLRRTYNDFQRTMRQVQIRQIQVHILRQHMQIDEMSRNRAPRENMVQARASIEEMESRMRSIMEEV